MLIRLRTIRALKRSTTVGRFRDIANWGMAAYIHARDPIAITGTWLIVEWGVILRKVVSKREIP